MSDEPDKWGNVDKDDQKRAKEIRDAVIWGTWKDDKKDKDKKDEKRKRDE